MIKKKRVIIVDDNESLAVMLEEHLNQSEGFEVIGIANNGDIGIKLIKTLKPDIVILDMVMPKVDGLSVLEKLHGHYGPDIVVLSAIGHDVITKRAMSLGALYYIIKPFEVNSFMERMNQLFFGHEDEKPLIMVANVNVKLEEIIAQELNHLSVPIHLKGYHYLKQAIHYASNHMSESIKVTKEVYPKVAEMNQTSASNVERAIRHAIDLTFTRGSVENIKQYFKNEVYNNKITNKEFIIGIAKRVKNR